MALYHYHVTQVLRSDGQTAIASAAYRSGERLVDHYYGEVQDYRAKKGVVYTEIMAPDYVPKRLLDRETLWNEVEKTERHPKAQLAYSFDIALMNEFSMEENLELAKKYVLENFVARGMIADMALHDPERDGIPNPHIHVLCPIRPYLEEGRWGEKQHREYLFDADGNPVLDKKGKQLFNAVQVTDWGHPETLEMWRKAWADIINAHYEEKGMDIRIDHRSYKEQGIDKVPQIHEGPHVRQMERKGIRTDKGDYNRMVKDINAGIESLRDKLQYILRIIHELSREIRCMHQKPQEVSLSDVIIGYFDERYLGAGNKGKIRKVKNMSEFLIYLRENNITTTEDLLGSVSSINKKLQALGEANNARTKRISEIKEVLKYETWYQECLPVIKKLETVKFKGKREQIKKDNDTLLRRYYVARRILTEKHLMGTVDTAVLQSELKKLSLENELEYENYKKLKKEVQLVNDICKFAKSQIDKERTKIKTREDIER